MLRAFRPYILKARLMRAFFIIFYILLKLSNKLSNTHYLKVCSKLSTTTVS